MKRRKPLKRSAIKRKPTAKAKKPKKTTVQKLEAEANKLMGLFIRGEGKCFAQGKVDIQATGPVQNAHIKRRSKSKAIKFSPLNGIPLRAAPHFCFDNDNTRFAVFLNKWLPGRMERLEEMSEWAKKNSGLFRMEDVLEAHIAWYKAKLEDDYFWWNWYKADGHVGYEDPIEALMRELG